MKADIESPWSFVKIPEKPCPVEVSEPVKFPTTDEEPIPFMGEETKFIVPVGVPGRQCLLRAKSLPDTPVFLFDEKTTALGQEDGFKAQETSVTHLHLPEDINAEELEPLEETQSSLLDNRETFTSPSCESLCSQYFNVHKIEPLFNFMVQNLLVDMPDHPLKYLAELLDRMLMWRSGAVATPPLLFTPKHLLSLFRSFDAAREGHIPINFYHTAFKTLFIDDYEKYPPLNVAGKVEEDTFVKNGVRSQERALEAMVGGRWEVCEAVAEPGEPAPAATASTIAKATDTAAAPGPDSPAPSLSTLTTTSTLLSLPYPALLTNPVDKRELSDHLQSLDQQPVLSSITNWPSSTGHRVSDQIQPS